MISLSNPVSSNITVTRAGAHTTARAVPPVPARPELTASLAAMLRAAGLEGCALELALVDDARMEELNLTATGNPGPTNILSFPAEEPLDGGKGEFFRTEINHPFLGWMALSVDTLLRECLLYGQDPTEHCVRLLAHGLAHLTGLDHGHEFDSLAALFEQSAAKKLA
jgi:probable rRNA maturation factor